MIQVQTKTQYKLTNTWKKHSYIYLVLTETHFTECDFSLCSASLVNKRISCYECFIILLCFDLEKVFEYLLKFQLIKMDVR